MPSTASTYVQLVIYSRLKRKKVFHNIEKKQNISYMDVDIRKCEDLHFDAVIEFHFRRERHSLINICKLLSELIFDSKT